MTKSIGPVTFIRTHSSIVRMENGYEDEGSSIKRHSNDEWKNNGTRPAQHHNIHIIEIYHLPIKNSSHKETTFPRIAIRLLVLAAWLKLSSCARTPFARLFSTAARNLCVICPILYLLSKTLLLQYSQHLAEWQYTSESGTKKKN